MLHVQPWPALTSPSPAGSSTKRESPLSLGILPLSPQRSWFPQTLPLPHCSSLSSHGSHMADAFPPSPHSGALYQQASVDLRRSRADRWLLTGMHRHMKSLAPLLITLPPVSRRSPSSLERPFQHHPEGGVHVPGDTHPSLQFSH